MSALWEASGAFAIHLLKLLGQDCPEHNVFCSPVSTSSALAMVLLGAKGSTVAQMVQALGLSSVEDPHGGFQSLLPQVHRPGAPYTLSIVYRLFGEESCEFLPSFQESCLRFYQAKLEPLSFTKAPERSRNHIDAWVSRKTEAPGNPSHGHQPPACFAVFSGYLCHPASSLPKVISECQPRGLGHMLHGTPKGLQCPPRATLMSCLAWSPACPFSSLLSSGDSAAPHFPPLEGCSPSVPMHERHI